MALITEKSKRPPETKGSDCGGPWTTHVGGDALATLHFFFAVIQLPPVSLIRHCSPLLVQEPDFRAPFKGYKSPRTAFKYRNIGF